MDRRPRTDDRGAIGLLVVTGVANMHYRGWLRWDGVLDSAAFWRTGTGRALAWKLGTVGVIVTTSALHDFVLGPAASRATAGSPESLRLRRRAALLARFTAFVGIVIVVAACGSRAADPRLLHDEEADRALLCVPEAVVDEREFAADVAHQLETHAATGRNVKRLYATERR